MRKEITIKCLLAIMLAAMTVSCDSCRQPSKLETIAKAVDKLCPIPLGRLGSIESVKCSVDTVIFAMYFDEEESGELRAMKRNEDLWKKSIMYGISGNGNDIFRKMTDDITDAGGNERYEVKGKQSGDMVTITLSNEELRKIRELNADPFDVLNSRIELTNSILPKDIDVGMTMTKLTIEGKYVVYNYVLDEDLYVVEEIANNIEEAKELLLEELAMDDSWREYVRDTFREAGMGVAYRYVGNKSGKEVIIKIERWEY